MATFDRSTAGNTVPYNPPGPAFHLSATYDASAYAALAANDIVQLLDVPPKTIVQAVKWEVVSADTTSARTMNVGDGTTANQFTPAAAVSVSAVGSGVTLELGTFATTAKYYPTGGTIQFTAVTAISNAKIKITAYCLRGDI